MISLLVGRLTNSQVKFLSIKLISSSIDFTQFSYWVATLNLSGFTKGKKKKSSVIYLLEILLSFDNSDELVAYDWDFDGGDWIDTDDGVANPKSSSLLSSILSLFKFVFFNVGLLILHPFVLL